MSPEVQEPENVTAPAYYSAAQQRIITATFGLFARHGVSGTSLQMIADAIGVSKAAVYHQFRTKDEIVQAVAETEMARLEKAISEAERQDSHLAAREVLLARIIDVAVDRRRLVNVMQTDPYFTEFLSRHESFQRLMERLFGILAADQDDADRRVQAVMLMMAIAGAVSHPLVAALDDETLRGHLARFARRLLQIPGE